MGGPKDSRLGRGILRIKNGNLLETKATLKKRMKKLKNSAHFKKK